MKLALYLLAGLGVVIAIAYVIGKQKEKAAAAGAIPGAAPADTGRIVQTALGQAPIVTGPAIAATTGPAIAATTGPAIAAAPGGASNVPVMLPAATTPLSNSQTSSVQTGKSNTTFTQLLSFG